MAVTAPVSLSKIKTEFVGPNNFSAYVRGGAYVQNSTPNAAISTTVAGLRMSQFLGAEKTATHTVGKSGDASGTGSGSGSFSVTTNGVTATPSGGVGPFTYAWTHVGGTAATANSPSSASTTFSRTAAAGASYSGTMRCTVTDTGNGNVTAYVDVTVSTTHNSAGSNHTTSISQTNVSDYCVFETPTSYTCPCSQNLTANVSGGVGPFTYSWARISGDTQMVITSGASSATCLVQSTNPSGSAANYSATFRVTVTDTGNSGYQTTTDITISHTHDGF